MDWKLIFNFTVAMLALLNPFGNLPIFISFTIGDSRGVQRWLAFFVALTIFVFSTFFLLTGEYILRFFGISINAFRISGGILLLLIGLDMVQGKYNEIQRKLTAQSISTNDRLQARQQYRKLVVPLAIPLFIGPGAISTIILYSRQIPNEITLSGIIFALFIVSFVVFICLLLSQALEKILGNVALEIITRIMGLLLSAMGVQFMLTGLSNVTINFINPELLK
jgi:multiple antibiotic resistance protein